MFPAIEEDKVDSAAPAKSAEVKPAVTAEKLDSKIKDTKPSSALNNKDAAPFSKTGKQSHIHIYFNVYMLSIQIDNMVIRNRLVFTRKHYIL